MSDKKKVWFQSLVQFIKFGIVGLSNTLISYVVYLVGVWLGIHYLLASVLGFVISVLNSFYWNNKYVFQQGDEERNLWLTLVKTFMAYAATGLVLANILLYIWVDVLGISEYLGPVINLVITVPLNFVINKLWAFRGKRKGEA